MVRTSRLLGVGSVCALALVPLLAGFQMGPSKPQSPKITEKALIATDELKWVPIPGIDGAQQALLWGDPTKEAHRVFFKFPAGLKAPLHTHTHGDRGVIISGVLSLAVEGAPAKKLPAGSFFSMAGGTKHVTAVEGADPCVFYIEREGPFDVVMVEEKPKGQ